MGSQTNLKIIQVHSQHFFKAQKNALILNVWIAVVPLDVEIFRVYVLLDCTQPGEPLSGRWIGDISLALKVEHEHCLRLCEMNPACNYWSYKIASKDCKFYAATDGINSNKHKFVSGQCA